MSRLFLETYGLAFTIDGQDYLALKPLRSGEWLAEPALVGPDDSRMAPMATSLREVDGSSILSYHWQVAETAVTLRVEGYNVIGRHPHRPLYIVEETADNGTGRVTTRPYKRLPRPRAYYQPGADLSAKVARTSELQHRAAALLRETPSNKV